MSVGTLTGTKVLVLQIGAVLLGDTAGDPLELQMRQRSLREAATIALDTALGRSQAGVDWVGLDAQRRASRRNPTVAVNPDRLNTEALANPSVDRVPPSLTVGMRALSALTGSRYALVPAAVHVAGQDSTWAASYLMVLADTRSSTIMARLKSSGTGTSAEAALLAAASNIIADN